ncbi:MAG TPA: glycosyltransferase [Chloroflexia bacterium]|jgi:glycosyltransferase involved in cell wall biosynthesis
MKIALVHDYLNQYGGAERVLDALHGVYPSAPVYTSIYAPALMPGHYRGWDIRTSFMQRLPGVARRHQLYLPLYPFAVESYDLSGYDVVLSSSSAFAKGAITDIGTLHICYCHNPMRFAWNYHDYIKGERVGRKVQAFLPLVLNYVRLWDEVSARRVDAYIANSRMVARRIQKRYQREATVINPPVDTAHYRPDPDAQGDYFLIVSRLIPYKRIDLAIEAFNRLGLPLKVAGAGRQEAELRAMAHANIEFLGKLHDPELKRLYAGCKAFIFPGMEDFGITPLEAQASGRPVIAYGAGGALETVVPGVTGEFFKEQTADSLAEVVSRFNAHDYDPAAIRRHAETFDTEVFKRRIAEFVQRHLDDRR